MVILAHAFGDRYELPIPLLLFVFGGAAAVLVSFLIVAGRPVPPDDGTVVVEDRVPLNPQNRVGAAIGLLVLVLLVVAGIGGSQEVAENIVPTAFWLVVWIAVPLSCGMAGDWTRSLNPYATLARLADSPRARTMLLGDEHAVAWPRWLGWWPAVVTFAFVACGELVYNLTATLPRVTAYGLLVGALISAAMGFLFGADNWLNRGELFSVLFTTWGRLGFHRFGAPGRRGWGGGLDTPFDASPSRLVFVMLLLVSVSFDGLISTPSWRGVHRHLADFADGSAVGIDSLTMLVFATLVILTLAVFGIFAVAVTRASGRPVGLLASLTSLSPSLLPIGFGYLLAHNLQYLLVNGQLLIPLAGNPAGLDGWHLLPSPFDDSYEVRTKLLPAAVNWYIAVAVIVAVHVAAVVIAHRHLVRAAAAPDKARRSEYPWVVAMIGYTMVSLWLLAQPLVKDKPAATNASASAVVQR